MWNWNNIKFRSLSSASLIFSPASKEWDGENGDQGTDVGWTRNKSSYCRGQVKFVFNRGQRTVDESSGHHAYEIFYIYQNLYSIVV